MGVEAFWTISQDWRSNMSANSTPTRKTESINLAEEGIVDLFK